MCKFKCSFVALIVTLAFVISLLRCGIKEYANYTTKQETDYVSICLNDKTYVFYAASSKSDCGNQIGIVDNDDNDKVYEYKEFSSDEWIVNCYNDMGDTYMLMREVNTINIPEGLQSEYIWND